jgi:hypothetical protein
MPISDYAHHNEEAQRIWWEEEGRHAESDGEAWREERRDAEDAAWEEFSEQEDEELLDQLADAEHMAKWPMLEKIIRAILADRGVKP